MWTEIHSARFTLPLSADDEQIAPLLLNP